jgi:hypothetical protein
MDDARPDPASPGLARRAYDSLELSWIVGEAGEDRGHADADVDAGCCKSANRLQSARRWSGSRLGRPPDALVERREREVDLGAGAGGRLLEDVDVAHHERAARHDRERRPGGVQHLEAGPREPKATLSGLVRIGRGAERHLVAAPRRPPELAAENVGDVRLHPDRPSVAVVRRAVGTLFEVADVTERAPVHAAHVRVERPAKRHPPDLRQRRLARLDPILDAHASRIEHVFVRGQG